MSWGHYHRAHEYYEELWPILKNVGDIPAAFEILQSIARLLSRLGKKDDAYRALERGLALAREYGYRSGEVELFYEWALLLRTDDLEQAQNYCATAISSALSIQYLDKLVDSLFLQASLFLDQHQFAKAESSAAEGLRIATEMQDIKRSHQLNELVQDLKRQTGRGLFVSYTHSDKEFAKRLSLDLSARGFPVWWDDWEIGVGDSIVQKVEAGINTSAFLLALLSSESIKSKWVQREIGSAMMVQLSEERGITILPLLLQDCEVPLFLRLIKYADFRNDYEVGLSALLNKLVTD